MRHFGARRAAADESDNTGDNSGSRRCKGSCDYGVALIREVAIVTVPTR